MSDLQFGHGVAAVENVSQRRHHGEPIPGLQFGHGVAAVENSK